MKKEIFSRLLPLDDVQRLLGKKSNVPAWQSMVAP
jgi:hypothetical protein